MSPTSNTDTTLHAVSPGGGEEAPRADDPPALGVGVSTPPPPPSLNSTRPDPGLLLGQNTPLTQTATELPASADHWPDLDDDTIGFRPREACDLAASWFPRAPTVNKIERTVLTPTMRPLNDGTGRAVDTETGELIGLVTGQETNRAEPLWTRRDLVDGQEVSTLIVGQPKRVTIDTDPTTGAKRLVDPALETKVRRLVIGPGKVAVETAKVNQSDRAAAAVTQLFDDAEAAAVTAETPPEDRGDAPWNVVTVYTRKSRQRMRQRVAEADWWTALQVPGRRIGMLTLTYPDAWQIWAPDPKTINRQLQAIEKRLERALGYGPAFFWVREWQSRGAPHFHLGGVFPARVKQRPLRFWLSVNWFEVVGSGDPYHLEAGTRVDWEKGLAASDPNRLAAYFSNYTTGKGSKEYQHHPPEGWSNTNGSVGRHWGYMNVTFVRSEVRLNHNQSVEIHRYLRAYLASQKRTVRTNTGRIKHGGRRSRYVNRRYQLRSLRNAEDGFTFLTNDGPALATAIATALTPPEEPWTPGQRRPLP